jgi:hypothetical protein
VHRGPAQLFGVGLAAPVAGRDGGRRTVVLHHLRVVRIHEGIAAAVEARAPPLSRSRCRRSA